jgi:N-acetylmuramoyl-L-alanine amidase
MLSSTLKTCAIATSLIVACSSTEARATGSTRTQSITMVVIHSTGGPTCDVKTGRPIWIKSGTLEANIRFIENHPVLGIHYMIDRDGAVRTSIPEDQVGHHVFGNSERSVAIELINDGDGVDPFPDAQLRATESLVKDITKRWGITRQGVKRHSDLDQRTMSCDKNRRRKVDPGPAFPFDAVLDAVFRDK